MTPARALTLRHVRGELRRDAAVNTTLVAVIVLSAALMATGAMVIERLLGSVDALFEVGRPPHLLQMHKGDYDLAALDRFAAQHPEIESWFIEEMVGFDGAAIAWERPGTEASGDLAESLIDNLFVAQNVDFDLLVDETGQAPHPADGEIYVPVASMVGLGLEVGDRLTVTTDSGPVPFEVRGFVRDAQMASSLSASTRFLVSEADLDALLAAGGGAPEIIVEYLLTDPALAGDLERAYSADASLPANGQVVTHSMIRLLHTISDGLAAVALMLVALLLVAIALLAVRFVIRGRLEDDARTIGTMKAIGIADREITRMYLARYTVMTVVGCAVGGMLALLAAPLLLRGAAIHYAPATFGTRAAIVLTLALAVVAAIVILSCRRVLGKIRRIQVVDALVHGSTLDERQTARAARRRARHVRRTRLATAPGRSVASRLALIDLRADARQWALVPIVFFLSAMLVALPAHLLTTIDNPRFVTYMGSPQTDLIASLQNGPDLDAAQADLLADMSSDARFTDVRVYAQVRVEIETVDGWLPLRVEIGEQTPAIELVEGSVPGPGEIALSVLNAEEHRLATGDEITVRQDGEVSTAVVSGIYQDLTSGGLTAKMPGEVPEGALAYALYASTAEGIDPVALAAEYGERHPDAAIVPMSEYSAQTMSHMTGAFRGAAVLAGVFGIGVAALITVMFLHLRLLRERRSMGTLSAIGFSTAELARAVRGKTVVTAAVGIVLGSAAALLLGGPIISTLLAGAGLGVTHLELLPNPLVSLAYTATLTVTAYLGAVAVTRRLHRSDTSAWLRA